MRTRINTDSFRHRFPQIYLCTSVLVISVLICAYLVPICAYADFSSRGAGTSGAAFLKLGAGARPAALGEAYTAIADDANAIYWNTAGLATLRKNEFVAMRAELFQGLQYHFFAFAHPLGKNSPLEKGVDANTPSLRDTPLAKGNLQTGYVRRGEGRGRFGTIALGVNNLNVSGIEQRSADSDKPETTFAANDSAYTLAYGFKIPLSISPFSRGRRSEDSSPLVPSPLRGEGGGEGGINLGLGLKFIRQTLAGSAANAFALDLGSLYHSSELPLSIGLSVQNLGTDTKFKDTADPLPLTIKVGGSYRLGQSWRISGNSNGSPPLKGWVSEANKGGLLLALDMNVPRDNNPSFRFGSEFTRIFGENFSASLRGAGYQLAKPGDVSGIGGGIGLSAGMGITWRFFTFDFAWKPFKELGDTYRYSVKLKF